MNELKCLTCKYSVNERFCGVNASLKCRVRDDYGNKYFLHWESKEPKTNYEIFRDNMTIEYFVNLFSQGNCFVCPMEEHCIYRKNHDDCRDTLLKWANSEAKL